MVKKVVTNYHCNLAFSRKYSKAILQPLLNEAVTIQRIINEIPVLPAMAATIRKEIIRKSIYGTAAIEGNPLTEEKVGEILDKPEGKENVGRNNMEIRNLGKAYGILEKMEHSTTPLTITEKFIKDIHIVLTQDIDYEGNVPGIYRNTARMVGTKNTGGIYRPPKFLALIQTYMKEFINFINSDEVLKEGPIIRAALSHYHLSLIHPFGDGNGRTTRFFEALILRSAGMTENVPEILSNIYSQNVDEYYWAFSNSIKSKDYALTPFLEFVIKKLIISLNEVKDKIMAAVVSLTLENYYNFIRSNKGITQRELDLLMMLLKEPLAFNLKDLFHVVPFNSLYRKYSDKTARRDLNKLCDLKLLINENGNYQLNLRVLG